MVEIFNGALLITPHHHIPVRHHKHIKPSSTGRERIYLHMGNRGALDCRLEKMGGWNHEAPFPQWKNKKLFSDLSLYWNYVVGIVKRIDRSHIQAAILPLRYGSVSE